MAENSAISWCDHTFNPWWGCVEVSEGCRHCYAAALSKRTGRELWGPAKTTERMITKGPWSDIRKWQRRAAEGVPGVLGPSKPQLVFCASMADIFEDHPGVVEAREKVWELIRECPGLHFLLLTKRPENIAGMLPTDWGEGYPNAWLGTTIENWDVRHRADILRDIPALLRFISYEPAIGSLQGINLTGISWMIYGGESGPNFRPDDRQWARDMRTQCMREGVAFFYKQAAGKQSKTDPLLDGERVEEFPF